MLVNRAVGIVLKLKKKQNKTNLVMPDTQLENHLCLPDIKKVQRADSDSKCTHLIGLCL